jgi:hypothetical protein
LREGGMSCDGLRLPCAACGKDGTKLRCPCKRASYCDLCCQNNDWQTHRKMCAVDLTNKMVAICGEDGDGSPRACDARNVLAGVLTSHGRFQDAEVEYD